jgi:hypothetical protein
MKRVGLLLIFFVFSLPAHADTIYQWVDEEGTVNMADSYDKVPFRYRNRVEIKHYTIEGGTPSYILERPPNLLPGRPQGIQTDLYGRDETWWKEKVRPWKKQLEEATTRYEQVHHKFMKKAEELSAKRYGSKGQYKKIILELDALKEEMTKYQALISEANEKLDTLSREAKETKANPDWRK